MKTVNQISSISGVSVRTLHYYDAIDLLKKRLGLISEPLSQLRIFN